MNLPWPSDPHLRRWMLFVDGENLTFRGQDVAKSSGLALVEGDYWKRDVFLWFPNVRGRVALTNTESTIVRVQNGSIRSFYYTSLAGDEPSVEATRTKLKSLGFEPRVFKKESKEKKTKAVDVTLTTELLSNAYDDNFDVAVVITGDGDFVPALEEVKRRGKMVYVAFFGESGTSSRVWASADEFFELRQFFLDRWNEVQSAPVTEEVSATS